MRSRRSGLPCKRCGGQLFFERDLVHLHIACKCLQCGFIAAYFWIEPGGGATELQIAGRLADGSEIVDE